MLEEDVIDLRRYLEVLSRWRALIALVALVCAGTAAFLSFFVLPPAYEARATLMVNATDNRQRVVQTEEGLEAVVNTISRLPEITVNTYVGQLTSGALLDRVARKLPPGPEGSVQAADLAKLVKVTAVRDTNLIHVTATNTDPELAARIANTLSEEFLVFLSEKNREQLSKSVEFLREQAANVEKELQAAQSALQKVQGEPRAAAFLESQLKAREDELNAAQSRLRQLEQEAAALQAGLAALQGQLASVPPTIKVTTQEPVLDPQTGQPRRDPQTGQVVTEPVEREEPNPAYAALQQQVAQKAVAVQEKQAELGALRSRLGPLQDEAAKLRAELTAKRLEEQRLNERVDQLRRTLDTLNARALETQVASSLRLGEANVVVVSPALVPPHPVRPRKTLNVAVGLVLGIMAGVVLAFLLEYLDNTVKTAADVERSAGLATLGIVPRFGRVRS